MLDKIVYNGAIILKCSDSQEIDNEKNEEIGCNVVFRSPDY